MTLWNSVNELHGHLDTSTNSEALTENLQRSWNRCRVNQIIPHESGSPGIFSSLHENPEIFGTILLITIEFEQQVEDAEESLENPVNKPRVPSRVRNDQSKYFENLREVLQQSLEIWNLNKTKAHLLTDESKIKGRMKRMAGTLIFTRDPGRNLEIIRGNRQNYRCVLQGFPTKILRLERIRKNWGKHA